MRMPKIDSISHMVSNFLYREGPTDKEDLLNRCRGERSYNYNLSVQRMLKSGLLRETDGVIALAPELEARYQLLNSIKPKLGLVQPPEPPAFKPWTGKYNVSAIGCRNDAERRPDHSIFISGTTPDPLTGEAS